MRHPALQRIGRVYGWNDRPVVSITDDDAAAMLHDIADRRGKKATANQSKHLLHAMFKWAKQPGRKFVTVNPFADLPAPGGAIAMRDRFLSADEIRQVWRALDEPQSLGIKPNAATALPSGGDQGRGEPSQDRSPPLKPREGRRPAVLSQNRK